ncbi:MAG: hypothetical protein JW818_10640 [Pirellulales bacterium]|nr:hypothetical protein [Pirellulales bacterium]
MGHYLTSENVRSQFAKPISSLAKDLIRLCDRWNRACAAGNLSRPDLLLNDVMPEKALDVLRRFEEEASIKLEDAVAGIYRYRDSERRDAKKKAKKRR